MQIGDLVKMPQFGSAMGEAAWPEVGIVLRLSDEDPVPRGGPSKRIQIYWIDSSICTWEPKSWLEVVSESR